MTRLLQSRLCLAFALSLLALSLCGCTSSFERRWKSRAATAGSADAFSGRWEGSWRSDKHRGAGGRLRCVFTRLGERRYDAHFKANWMIFASSHRTTFETERRAGRLLFRGRQDLGPLFGGIYTYRGEATPTRFVADYDSSYDRGTFSMSRVAP